MLRFYNIKTCLILEVIGFSIASFVLSIFALAAGHQPNRLRNLAIATFDTSSVSSTLQTFLGSAPANIPDWFEPHFFSVCHGSWLTPGVKDLASAVCEARSPGYTFSLLNELATLAPSSAASFFAVLPSSYGTISTSVGLGLIATGFALMLISIFAYTYELVRTKDGLATFSLVLLRIAFFAGEFSAILLTNGSSQITSQSSDGVDSVYNIAQLSVTASMGRGFLIVIWMSTGMAWLAMIIGLTFAILTKSSLIQAWRGQRTCSRQVQTTSAPVIEVGKESDVESLPTN